jgi:hypothetical protein
MHLPDADQSRMVRAYREFLIRATASPLMDRLEGVLNYVCPKSVIVYGEKPAAQRARRSGPTHPDTREKTAETTAAAA